MLLPREQSLNVPQASPSQLAEVSACVFAKVSSLGFTHHIADTVTRIRQVYLSLAKNAPPQLLEGPSDDGLFNFLKGLSHALREGDTLLRVTGISGMATIAALSLLICPEDTVLTVEHYIIHEGSRRNIMIDIEGADGIKPKAPAFQTFFELETLLSGPRRIHTEGVRGDHTPAINSRSKHYTYSWESWLLDTAKIRFMEHGYVFPESAPSLIASIIVRMHKTFWVFEGDASDKEDPIEIGLSPASLLGPEANVRLSGFCQQTLGAEPSFSEWTIEKLVQKLVEECHFEDDRLPDHRSWDSRTYEWKTCQLVSDMASLITDGFMAVFISPGQKVSLTSRRKIFREVWLDGHNKDSYVQMTTEDHVNDLCREINRLQVIKGVHALLSMIYGLMYTQYPLWADLDHQRAEKLDYPRSYENFGQGSDCCVLYPAVLDEMILPLETGLVLRLEPGHFLLEGRRYRELRAQTISKGYIGKSASTLMWPLRPTNIGKHQAPVFTAHERFQSIELRLEVTVDGRRERLNIPGLVTGACALETLAPCEHRRDEPLSLQDAAGAEDQIRIIGVEAFWDTPKPKANRGWWPQARMRKRGNETVAFALTKGNPEAQLFSMAMAAFGPWNEDSCFWRYFLQGDCCMKCALNRLKRSETYSSLVILT